MKVFLKSNEISSWCLAKIQAGDSIGFVPTMGALHDGHKFLISKCSGENDISVVSIFVNPTQFNDPKDFEKYPRLIDQDLEMLEKLNVSAVFIPSKEEIYPEGKPEILKIDLGRLGNTLEAAFRPGHFDGVVTVVYRLFSIVQPQKAYFGLKDFQQLMVVKKLIEVKQMGIEIVPCEIIREHDGLAMSSRNMLLDEKSRGLAPNIYKILTKAKNLLTKEPVEKIREDAILNLKAVSEFDPEYFEIIDTNDFSPVDEISETKEAVILTAVKIGGIRLIDNILVKN